MGRKQDVIQLVVEQLLKISDVKYDYVGPDTVMDEHLISLNFSLSTRQAKGTLTVRGFIDAPLILKAQYDVRSSFYDQVNLQRRIDKDLKAVAAFVNKHL